MSSLLSEKEKEEEYGAKCPVCDTAWTKTPRIVNGENWWHCVKCEKKAEDIPKKKKEVFEDWGFSKPGWF